MMHFSGINNLKKQSEEVITWFRYPAGCRLSPKSGSVSDIQQLPTYYIPTESETRHDEKVSVAEYPAAERKARKVSLFIDQNTKRYSGTVSTYIIWTLSNQLISLTAEKCEHRKECL